MNNLELKNIDKTWTLFLDRDGVINKRIFGGYVKNTREFEFLPGVLESISYFSNIFGRIIIITNQQGVGKGIMSESELETVHEYMEDLISENGGRIDGILYCTDLATNEENCRKPSPKMANKARELFPEIELAKSIMAGDSLSDIRFGKNAGMYTVYITSSEMNEEAKTLSDLSVESLQKLKTLFDKVSI